MLTKRREAAQGDAGQDRHATRELQRARRIAEHRDASDGADQRLEVDKSPGDLR